MKALGWIIGLVVLLIVGIGVYVVMNSGALLKQAIEGYGTDYLGAPVTVDTVNVSLTEGSAGLDELVIGNPADYSGPAAFRLGRISATLDTSQISSELVVLKDVTIDGAEVNVLAKGQKTNLQALMDHLNREIGATDAAEETGTSSEVRLIIDRFSFTNAKASVDSDVLGQAEVTVPDIRLSDIGRQSNGATVGQALKQILDPIVRAVTRRMIEQGVDLEGARERLEEDLREKATDKIGEGLENLTNRLRSGDQ
jgi:hypothetical protein